MPASVMSTAYSDYGSEASFEENNISPKVVRVKKKHTDLLVIFGIFLAFIGSLGISFGALTELFQLLGVIPVVGLPLAIAIVPAISLITLVTATALFARSIKDVFGERIDYYDEKPKWQRVKEGTNVFFSAAHSIGESATFFTAIKSTGLPLWITIPLTFVSIAMYFVLGKGEVGALIFGNKPANLEEAEAEEKQYTQSRLSANIDSLIFYSGGISAFVLSVGSGVITVFTLSALIPAPFGLIIGLLIGSGVALSSTFILVQTLKEFFNRNHNGSKSEPLPNNKFHIFTQGIKTFFANTDKFWIHAVALLNAIGSGVELFTAMMENVYLIPILPKAVLIGVAALFGTSIGITLYTLTYNFCVRLFSTGPIDNTKAIAENKSPKSKQHKLKKKKKNRTNKEHFSPSNLYALHLAKEQKNTKTRFNKNTLPKSIWQLKDIFRPTNGISTKISQNI